MLLITTIFSEGQVTHTVSGIVRDKKSGETLIGASVRLMELPKTTTLSNAYGFYSITAPAGQYILIISFSGLQTDSIKITLEKDLSQPAELLPQNTDLQEVVVSATRRDANVTRPLMGVQKLSVKEIQALPVIFGEKDILKSLQLLPGVQSAGDGSSGFYVRGGNDGSESDPAG